MSSVYPRRQRQLESLVQKFGLSLNAPVKWQLLDLALTHPTVSDTANYEQLEFCGRCGGTSRGGCGIMGTLP